MTLTDPFYTMQDMRDSHTATEFHRLAAESTSNFHRTGDPYHLALAEAADALAVEAAAAHADRYRPTVCVDVGPFYVFDDARTGWPLDYRPIGKVVR